MKLFAGILACALFPAIAAAEPVVVPAKGTVQETVDRLQAVVANAGARVFTVVDFGAGAKGIGKDIGDIQLVVFGNPEIGAAALSADPLAALDLPAKVLVYETAGGTELAYEAPSEMLAEWSIPIDAPVLQIMSSTLEGITAKAANW
ncbi:MAG: DUF302 domain-containing protein [Paracoccaceae bacterium]|nr:DUF302 domain-containing protein [Paracoccaceae bacterium]